MAGFIKDNIGDWKNIVPRIKINDTGFDSDWKRPDSGWVKTASGWKQWYAGNVADPTLVVASTTTSSATITISNYNASLTYTDLTSTAGTASRTAQTISITGLTPGQAVTVSIRANLLGTPSEIGQITTSATPDTPTFGASTNVTFTSFTVPISNYNASYTYSVTVSQGSVERVGASINVTGLPGPATPSQISVTATTSQGRPSAVGQVTRSTNSLVNPTIDANTPTLSGFTITLGNVTGGYSYTITPNPSLTITKVNDTTYTASGAAKNTSYTVSVFGTFSGYNTATASDTITTLDLSNPALEETSKATRSLQASITTATYNSTYTYTWSINPSGGTLSVSGRTATYTGLSPNTSYTVSVYGTISGQNTSTASITIGTRPRWSTTGTLATPVSYPGYTLLQFTSAGSITYNEAINSVRVAVVGGGGAGGSTSLSETTWWVASGGGGGGQVNQATVNEPASTTRAIALGAGGAVGGANAGSSSYGSTTANGGGSGRIYVSQTNTEWNNTTTRTTNASAPSSPGGPGGGGSGVVRVTPTPISGVAGNGAAGGAPNTAGGSGYFRTDSQSRQGGGGGGGAGPQSSPAGATPNSGNQGGTYWGADFDGGGVGATGRQLWATELNTLPANSLYAGGGGGGGGATRFGPLGGANNIHGLAFFGGGGTGSVSNQNGTGSRASTAGTSNLGGGGGGGFNTVGTASHKAGSNGGSGTVFILIPN